MHTIEAPTDVRESEVAKKALIDAVALQRRQGFVLWRQLGAVEEGKSSHLHGVVFVSGNFEFRIQLPWKDHRRVPVAVIGSKVVRSETERTLLRARSYRICWK